MRSNSLQEVLLAAATSPDPILRNSASQKLEELRDVDSKRHIDQVILLLQSAQQDIHTISYSYLLNGFILKNNRFNYDITPKLQEIYQAFHRIQGENVWRDPAIRFRVENLVKLAASYYSKPNHTFFAEAFLRKLTNGILSHQEGELMPFHMEVLEDMNQVLQRPHRVAIGTKITNILLAAVEQLWKAQQRDKFEYGIELSYYASIFNSLSHARMLPFVTQLSINDPLLWKIVGRLNVAFLEDKFNPSFQVAIQTYRATRQLASSINLNNLSQRRNASQQREMDLGLERMLELLQGILGLLYGTLSCTFRANMNEEQHKILEVEILNLYEYDILMGWLIAVCSFEDNVEEDTAKPLKEYAFDIIELFSERMNDSDLQIYYKRVRNNINSANQEQILSLLFGANKQVMELFDCQSIVKKIVNYNIEVSLSGSFVYYLFVGKYLKMNQYMLEKKMFEDICEFILRHLHLQEEQLNASTDEKHSNHHLLKISHLLIIATQLVNYPWTQLCNSSIPYLVKKIFYYLANSIFGLPENAHENLFEAIIAIFSRKNQSINYIVYYNAVQVYSDCFLKQREGQSVGKMNLLCKVQQEFLIIIKESISITNLNSDHSKELLERIVNNPPENDEVIQKEVIALLQRIISLHNYQLIGKPNQEIIERNRNFFFIQFQKIASVIVQSLILQRPLQDAFENLVQNYQQMFCQRISEVEADFSTAILFLLDLSCYPVNHDFLDCMVIQILKSHEFFTPIAEKILSKCRLKGPDVKQAALKIGSTLQLVNCLLESLYINPLWRSPGLVTTERMMIANHPQFLKCKGNVETLYAASLTDMMRHVSLNEGNRGSVYWSKRYEIILKDCPAKWIIDEWFLNFKA